MWIMSSEMADQDQKPMALNGFVIFDPSPQQRPEGITKGTVLHEFGCESGANLLPFPVQVSVK